MPVEVFVFFAVGNHGTHACFGVKPRNATAASAHAFGQCALWVEF